MLKHASNILTYVIQISYCISKVPYDRADYFNHLPYELPEFIVDKDYVTTESLTEVQTIPPWITAKLEKTNTTTSESPTTPSEPTESTKYFYVLDENSSDIFTVTEPPPKPYLTGYLTTTTSSVVTVPPQWTAVTSIQSTSDFPWETETTASVTNLNVTGNITTLNITDPATESKATNVETTTASTAETTEATDATETSANKTQFRDLTMVRQKDLGLVHLEPITTTITVTTEETGVPRLAETPAAVNSTVELDKFSKFLEKLMKQFALKNKTEARRFFTAFHSKMTTLVSEGRFNKLGPITVKYLQMMLTGLEAPTDIIKRAIAVGYYSLTTREQSLSADTNALLDFLDSTYDWSERLCMQRVLNETSTYPGNNMTAEDITNGAIEDIIHNPYRRTEGTGDGNYLNNILYLIIEKRYPQLSRRHRGNRNNIEKSSEKFIGNNNKHEEILDSDEEIDDSNEVSNSEEDEANSGKYIPMQRYRVETREVVDNRIQGKKRSGSIYGGSPKVSKKSDVVPNRKSTTKISSSDKLIYKETFRAVDRNNYSEMGKNKEIVERKKEIHDFSRVENSKVDGVLSFEKYIPVQRYGVKTKQVANNFNLPSRQNRIQEKKESEQFSGGYFKVTYIWPDRKPPTRINRIDKDIYEETFRAVERHNYKKDNEVRMVDNRDRNVKYHDYDSDRNKKKSYWKSNTVQKGIIESDALYQPMYETVQTSRQVTGNIPVEFHKSINQLKPDIKTKARNPFYDRMPSKNEKTLVKPRKQIITEEVLATKRFHSYKHNTIRNAKETTQISQILLNIHPLKPKFQTVENFVESTTIINDYNVKPIQNIDVKNKDQFVSVEFDGVPNFLDFSMKVKLKKPKTTQANYKGDEVRINIKQKTKHTITTKLKTINEARTLNPYKMDKYFKKKKALSERKPIVIDKNVPIEESVEHEKYQNSFYQGISIEKDKLTTTTQTTTTEKRPARQKSHSKKRKKDSSKSYHRKKKRHKSKFRKRKHSKRGSKKNVEQEYLRAYIRKKKHDMKKKKHHMKRRYYRKLRRLRKQSFGKKFDIRFDISSVTDEKTKKPYSFAEIVKGNAKQPAMMNEYNPYFYRARDVLNDTENNIESGTTVESSDASLESTSSVDEAKVTNSNNNTKIIIDMENELLDSELTDDNKPKKYNVVIDNNEDPKELQTNSDAGVIFETDCSSDTSVRNEKLSKLAKKDEVARNIITKDHERNQVPRALEDDLINKPNHDKQSSNRVKDTYLKKRNQVAKSNRFENSADSDNEWEVKKNLYDAFRHADARNTQFRRNILDEYLPKVDSRDIDFTDEEVVLKRNIYKVFKGRSKIKNGAKDAKNTKILK